MTSVVSILVGGDARHVGKTTLIAHLARALSQSGWRVIAIKLRHGDGPLSIRKDDETTAKPLMKPLIQRGDAQVYFITTPSSRLKAIETLLNSHGLTLTKPSPTTPSTPPTVVLIESNALRFDMTPDVFIHIEGDGEPKPTAVRTAPLADIRLKTPISNATAKRLGERLLKQLVDDSKTTCEPPSPSDTNESITSTEPPL